MDQSLTADFVRTYSDRIYRHTAMVNHQGAVVALAMDSAGRIFYTVLSLHAAASHLEATIDQRGWQPQPSYLPFPTELVEIGTARLTKQNLRACLPPFDAPNATDEEAWQHSTGRLTAAVPFVALSHGSYIYVFRQAVAAGDPMNLSLKRVDGTAAVKTVDRTLLMDRYLLVERQLVLKREVRYRRSGSLARPASTRDTLGAADMAGRPFHGNRPVRAR